MVAGTAVAASLIRPLVPLAMMVVFVTSYASSSKVSESPAETSAPGV